MESHEIAIFVALMVPLASLCFGLTLRLAIKPFVETLSAITKEHRRASPGQAELRALRAQLHDLTDAVESLRAKVEFDRQLVPGPSGGGGSLENP
jgi:hypothetical protein